MANTIKIKRNTSDSDAPTTSNIAQGELGFTEATQILFYRDASDNIRKIGGEGAFLRSDTNDTFNGNLTITGNLDVQGTTTTIDSTTVSITDPFIKLSKDNTGNSVDIGFYGKYVESATTKFAGIARDADDSGKFVLFDGLQAEPTTTVNTSGTGFNKQTLKANIEGNLAGSPTITAATIATSLDMNGNELILDADADTSIHSSTDDEIDIKIGGSDELKLTGTAFSPATNAGQDLGTSSLKFGNLHINSQVNTATISASSQITSTLSTGTAPFVIASTTAVSNLNADLLDGQHAPSGDIVGTSDTQTLTNKTLTSPVLSTPQINDTSANHQYVFAVSELAADRTVTLPLLGSGDTFVFANHTQTLDNKTIDGGTY
tara:strand:- start:645 stop:1772 length:1128 start_codon:yes stop_codon:yes gene_type:complete